MARRGLSVYVRRYERTWTQGTTSRLRSPTPRWCWIETPTNPMMKVVRHSPPLAIGGESPMPRSAVSCWPSTTLHASPDTSSALSPSAPTSWCIAPPSTWEGTPMWLAVRVVVNDGELARPARGLSKTPAERCLAPRIVTSRFEGSRPYRCEWNATLTNALGRLPAISWSDHPKVRTSPLSRAGDRTHTMAWPANKCPALVA